jgi:hypothetical protein
MDRIRMWNTENLLKCYRWEKAVGDSVSVDEVLCEIETDKTSVPVSTAYRTIHIPIPNTVHFTWRLRGGGGGKSSISCA